jgi:hypothetical protein
VLREIEGLVYELKSVWRGPSNQKSNEGGDSSNSLPVGMVHQRGLPGVVSWEIPGQNVDENLNKIKSQFRKTMLLIKNIHVYELYMFEGKTPKTYSTLGPGVCKSSSKQSVPAP